MKIKKVSLALVVAALCSGAVAAVSATQYIHNNINVHRSKLDQRYQVQPFVVASRPLTAGSVISESDLEILSIVPDGIQADAFVPGQLPDLIGTTAKYDLTPGAVILQTHVSFSDYDGLISLVNEGEKLITIAVNALSSISGMLEPEDRVDILFTDANAVLSSTVTLLTDIRVIATGQQVKSDQSVGTSDMGYNTVTLSCKPNECQQLTHAQSHGELSLLMTRDVTQNGHYPKSTTTNDLLGTKKPEVGNSKRKKPKLARVQVYGAGKLIQ